VKSSDIDVLVTRVHEDMLLAATDVEHSITVKCPNKNNSAPNKEVIIIKGTVLAKNIAHCSVSGTGFTMLPRYSIQKYDRVQYRYTEVLYMGNYSHIPAHVNHDNMSHILEVLESHDWEGTPNPSFTKLLADLNNIKSAKNQLLIHSAASASISVSVVAIGTAGVVLALWFLKKWCFKPEHTFVTPIHVSTQIETPVKTEEDIV